jgi:hypothetical protein
MGRYLVNNINGYTLESSNHQAIAENMCMRWAWAIHGNTYVVDSETGEVVFHEEVRG